MGGRTIGFLAGATFSTSLLYLGVLGLQRNSRLASDQIRNTRLAVDNITERPFMPAKVVEYKERASIGETVKDLWDDEIVRGSRWLLNIPWAHYRDWATDKVTHSLFKKD